MLAGAVGGVAIGFHFGGILGELTAFAALMCVATAHNWVFTGKL